MHTSPTSEERVWAVLAHLSALALGMGILLPIVGWSEQRRKSNYASFQCLQALGYQSLGYTVWALVSLVVLIAFVVIRLPTLNEARGTGAVEHWISTYVTLMLGLLSSYFIPPIIAAIACGFGKDFHYPIMGNRLATYLGYEPANERESLIEEHEHRWVASMGHFAVIIFLWGALVPVTAWVTQGTRSVFLKFQSIQTLVLHAVVTILYLGALFTFMFGFFAFLAAAALSGSTQNIPVVGTSLLLIFSLIAWLIVLVIPLFHILGQWAGYRLLKGDDYKYPIIGKLVTRWMAKNKMSL